MLNMKNIFYKIYLTSIFILFYIFFLITLLFSNYAYSEDTSSNTIDDIITTISKLTCETEGVGNLLRSEFDHTCLPASFFTMAVGNALSAGVYPAMMLRLKINDPESELFSNFPKGQCKRVNRADPKNPKISFALCNNFLLAAVRAEALLNATVAIAAAAFTGQDPWNDIAAVWNVSKKKYHNIYDDAKVGDSGINLDVNVVPPAVPLLSWKILQIDDRICVATLSLGGWIPVGCKYIKEPYPESVYASFMNQDAPKSNDTSVRDNLSLTTCSIMNSPYGNETCYQRAYDSSKSAIVISAPLIECIKEMSSRLLFGTSVCSFDDINNVMSKDVMRKSSFFTFQKNMRSFVVALLTIYVAFFGVKILLTAHEIEQKDIINFIIKIIFVTYFSIGINSNNVNDDRLDGMTSLAFPFLLNGVSELSNWVMNASPSGLCDFSKEKYDKKMQHLSLWDSLDCRVAHYLGLDTLATLAVENMSRTRNFKDFDIFNFSIPPYIYLLIPAIFSGNTTLISLAISYPLLVISVAAFLVNSVVMCFVAIAILGILAPLFVPMYLFEYTRGYFDSWAKLMLSFILQPMVAVTFMIFMFGVYDFGFYGTCKYISKEIGNTITDGGDGKRKVKIFYIDNDFTNYTEEDARKCKNSLGFMLNNPFSVVGEFIKDKIPSGDRSTGENILKGLGIAMGPGLFFSSPKLLYEKVRDMSLALMVACFILYLMYHFSSQLDKFMADMTNSVSLGSVTIGAQTIFKAGMKAVGAAGGAAGAAKGGAGGAGGDKMSTSRGGTGGDKMSTGGAGGDKMSTGGGAKATDSISSAAKNIARKAMDKVTDTVKTDLNSAIDEGTNSNSSTNDNSPKDNNPVQDLISGNSPQINSTSVNANYKTTDNISSQKDLKSEKTATQRSGIKDIEVDKNMLVSDKISSALPQDSSANVAGDKISSKLPQDSNDNFTGDKISSKLSQDSNDNVAGDKISSELPQDSSDKIVSDKISSELPQDSSDKIVSDKISSKLSQDSSANVAGDKINSKPVKKMKARNKLTKNLESNNSNNKQV